MSIVRHVIKITHFLTLEQPVFHSNVEQWNTGPSNVRSVW
jgi:hypothetical protein